MGRETKGLRNRVCCSKRVEMAGPFLREAQREGVVVEVNIR